MLRHFCPGFGTFPHSGSLFGVGSSATSKGAPKPSNGGDAIDPMRTVEVDDDSAGIDDAESERDRRDRQLVRRVRGGDERAFEELVRSYQNRIFGLMLRMIGNPQEAEDLAQEVFMTVYRAIGSYRGEGRFYTWLYRIAVNTCKNRIKYLHGRNFHRSVPVEEDTTNPEQGGWAGQVAGPEALTVGARLEAAIVRELAQLDPEHRLLIVLRDIQGLPYQEILRITGLQEGTLKSRLHRARVALKDRMKPHLR
jgi:RNA polymerase sigma-70 factor (ECF subfamily)